MTQMKWWKYDSWPRWCAMTATLLVLAACSQPTAKRPQEASDQALSSAGGTLTTLEGHIVGDSIHPGYTVEVPEGWSTEDGYFIVKGHFIVKEEPDVLGMSVWDVGEVPGHPCRWKGTETTPGPTVDDLVEALTSQRLRAPTEPTDVTLAGHQGRYLEWSVPDDWVVTSDSDFRGCDSDDAGHENFISWWGTDVGTRYQQVAGQVDHLWVLDVEGQTLLVDATYSPDTTDGDRQQLEQVVESLRFVEV